MFETIQSNKQDADYQIWNFAISVLCSLEKYKKIALLVEQYL